MQYKNVTAIIAEILKERDGIPLVIDKERYLPNPQPYIIGEALRGGLRKALRIIEEAPVADVVEVVKCEHCQNSRPLSERERKTIHNYCLICTHPYGVGVKTEDGKHSIVYKHEFCSYGKMEDVST